MPWRSRKSITMEQRPKYQSTTSYTAGTLWEKCNVRALIQRVREARVEVDGAVTGAIDHGLMVLLGVARTDTRRDADYLIHKLTRLRIFNDRNGKMNLSVTQSNGAVLIISQFTLYADIRSGLRPSFDLAARPEEAHLLYTYFLEQLRATGLSVQTGVFGASMQVFLINDGPVTILCDSAQGSHGHHDIE